MDKLEATFFRGNVNNFGLSYWNSPEKYNNYDTSQSCRISNINPLLLSNSQRQNDPNNIRSEYYQQKLHGITGNNRIDFASKFNYARNNYHNPNNFYKYDEYNELIGRRRNVKQKLEYMRNKLINDEKEELLNNQINLENKNDLYNISENEDFTHTRNSSVKILSNINTTKNSARVSTRSISASPNELSENNNNIEGDKSESLSRKKSRKNKKSASTSEKSVLSANKHTNIMNILANIEKYKTPINNTQKELNYVTKKTDNDFDDLFSEIKLFRKDITQKLKDYNQYSQSQIDAYNQILQLSNNDKMKAATDKVLFHKNISLNKKLKNEDYKYVEFLKYKPQLEKIINDAILKYNKDKIINDKKFQELYERDHKKYIFNYHDKQNTRLINGAINVINLYNKIDNTSSLYIKPTIKPNLDNTESIKNFDPKSSMSSNMFDFSDYNDVSSVFPAIEGIDKELKINEYKSDLESSLTSSIKNKISGSETKRLSMDVNRSFTNEGENSKGAKSNEENSGSANSLEVNLSIGKVLRSDFAKSSDASDSSSDIKNDEKRSEIKISVNSSSKKDKKSKCKTTVKKKDKKVEIDKSKKDKKSKNKTDIEQNKKNEK